MLALVAGLAYLALSAAYRFLLREAEGRIAAGLRVNGKVAASWRESAVRQVEAAAAQGMDHARGLPVSSVPGCVDALLGEADPGKGFVELAVADPAGQAESTAGGVGVAACKPSGCHLAGPLRGAWGRYGWGAGSRCG